MAELGPGPHRSGDIAEVLGRKVNAFGPTRAQLIHKGMIWSPSHGDTAFTVPLFDGFKTRGESIQAKSRLSSAEIEKQKLLDVISLEARDAFNKALEAIEIVSALEATLAQAERLLKMAETGYREGVKTRLEVNDAEFNLQSARSNLAIAKRDTIAARIVLLWIKGEDIQMALAGG